MIGSSAKQPETDEVVKAKGFDDYVVRLGDVMRGERATLGKSLLDVQRELKIKAAYIAAIENADPSAFETPGFIAGYVRSYARYLGMDPDDAFDQFCAESGFETAHGMSAKASSMNSRSAVISGKGVGEDIFSTAATPFIPAKETALSGLQPQALGSVAVLLAVIAGLGYGGWNVLQEVQRVELAPVDQSPVLMSELDPIAGSQSNVQSVGLNGLEAPTPDVLDRLYRPQALDVPVLVARDAPISTLTPDSIGTILPSAPVLEPEFEVAQGVLGDDVDSTVQVVEPDVPELQLVAVRPAWVRVQSPDGSIIFEGVMAAGDSFVVPSTEEPGTLRVGESGALYFAINGVHHGPVGETGVVTSNVSLSPEALATSYQVADLDADTDLAEIVSFAQATAVSE